MILRVSTVAGRHMPLVRQMMLSLAAVALFAGPAAAQTHWLTMPQTRSGETMAVMYASADGYYPNVAYGVLRSRPEGYFRQLFLMDCSRGTVRASSWGFVLWSGGTQSDSSLLELLPENGRNLARAIQCDNQWSPTYIQGRDEALWLLREFQTTQ